MLIWILASLLTLVLVKYYTAMEMRKLEERLNAARADLERYRSHLQDAQERLDTVRAEEEQYEERIRFMKELIEDLNVRLTQVDRSREDIIGESPDRTHETF